MNRRYIAFDVETPNLANDRVSAIGISIIENGQIIKEFYSLVNPEARFDAFNINFTGITPEMVSDQPAFPELWETIEPLMDSGLLIAHNAQFDMSVIAKCLRDYNIRWHTRTNYACTCQMARKALPDLPNHRLNTLCSYLELYLNHHHAGSDSHACAELMRFYLDSGLYVDDFIHEYDLINIHTIRRHKYIKS